MTNVRQFQRDDWKAYKAIRLEGLELYESRYGNSLATEQNWGDDVWIETLTSPKSAVFGLYDAGRVIGSSAAFTDRGDTTGRTCLLAGSYIRKEYQGQGLSRLFYQARMDWARNHGGFDRIIVGHREGNEASRRANQAFGFKFFETQEKTWGDGSTGKIHIYEMRLR